MIYIIMDGDYESSWIVEATTNKDKAEELLSLCTESCWLEEFEDFNKPLKGLKKYRVEIFNDGFNCGPTAEQINDFDEECGGPETTCWGIWNECWAKDEEDAVRITEEDIRRMNK